VSTQLQYDDGSGGGDGDDGDDRMRLLESLYGKRFGSKIA
jgi:hypothetical protein